MSIKSKASICGASLAALAWAVLIAPAAQAADAPAAADGSTTTTLQEVVVTAQKKAENLQDVPASVTALSAQNLELTGAVTFADLVTKVPGMSIVTASPGYTVVTLRGMGTGAGQSSATTSFYVDEAPVGSVNAYGDGSSLTPNLDPSDLSRIDVLKGPQGTLYGSGAVGGVFKYVTTDPNTQNFGGRLEVGGDTVDHGGTGSDVRGALNIPIMDGVAGLRISGYDRDDPGYIDNVALGQKNVNDARYTGGRIDLLVKPLPDLSIDLWAMNQHVTAGGLPTELVEANGAGGLTPVYGDYKNSFYYPQTLATNLNLFNGTIKWVPGPVTITSSTTYQIIRGEEGVDGTDSYGVLLGAVLHIPDLGIGLNTNQLTKRWSEELRADGNALNNKLTYQVGLYFTDETDLLTIPSFATFLTPSLTPITLPKLIAAEIASSYREYAVFGNLDYHFTDSFDVLIGGRISRADQDYYQNYSGLLVGATFINSNSFANTVSTFLISPKYTFADGSIVYGRVASGWRPGGPNAAPPALNVPGSFAPDTLTSYEIGYKTTFDDKRVVLDVAAYYIDWQHIQIETSSGGFKYFVNGGNARSEGAEATLSWNPAPGLYLTADGAYTDAVLTSAAPAAGGLSGDQQPYVPKWSGALSADYEHQVGGGFTGAVGGSIDYVGKRVSQYSLSSPYVSDRRRLHRLCRQARVAVLAVQSVRHGVVHDAESARVAQPRWVDDRPLRQEPCGHQGRSRDRLSHPGDGRPAVR